MFVESPSLSIIVPVYNVEKYLHKCIDSILAQTFTDFELILVNDGSTDKSGYICDEYSIVDSRIFVIHKENGGQSSARNRGLDVAKGKYITFVDSDDYISTDCYKENMSILLANNDIDIIQYPIYIVDGNKTQKQNIPLYDEGKIISTKNDLFAFWSDGGNGVRGYVVQNIYKSLIFKTLRFKENITFEDCYIQSDILEIVNRVYISGIGKYFYIQHEISTLHSKDTVKKCNNDFDATIRFLEKMQKYSVDKNLFVKCYCTTKNRILDKSYYWGINTFAEYINRIDKLNIRLFDVLACNIEIKKKVKLMLCKIIGTKYYLSLTAKLLNR